MGRQKADERDYRLGQRLFKARKQADITQLAISKIFGISKTQISKYENGTDRVSAIYLDTLSRLTNTPITEFLDAIHETDKPEGAGFSERPQANFGEADAFQGLASAVASHVNEHFGEDARREFVAAVSALSRELKRTKPKTNERPRSVKRTGSANRVDRPE